MKLLAQAGGITFCLITRYEFAKSMTASKYAAVIYFSSLSDNNINTLGFSNLYGVTWCVVYSLISPCWNGYRSFRASSRMGMSSFMVS